MDTETIKSVVSILVWGAFFLLMMRFGCGAHIMGGHRHHGSHGGDEGAGTGGPIKDPVCGMDVDPSKAAAASVYAGRTHYFCSASCRDKFEKEPHRYAAATAAGQPPPGGQHHG
ncbi:MAG: YHS domain-containing protein [Betaproteobacteria bacterium]|nr:YHS domain-containing protein [Betaproteobacteria bacterium]